MHASDDFEVSPIIQDRDIAILLDLFESRIMTTFHIADIHFDGKIYGARKRLLTLKDAGFIDERPRLVQEPAVLYLSARGLEFLKTRVSLENHPKVRMASRGSVSELTLAHELEVMNVKAAFHKALKRTPNATIAEFSTWPALHQFKAARESGSVALVKPDGYIRIRVHEASGVVSDHLFFLEVDRSTESLSTFASKAALYRNYYQSGRFAKRNGSSRSAFDTHPFRVLSVFTSEERRNYVADRLLRLNRRILAQMYLATLNSVKSDPFGPIWISPAGYRDALRNSPFDVDKTNGNDQRRSFTREALVEERVKKLPLFAVSPSSL